MPSRFLAGRPMCRMPTKSFIVAVLLSWRRQRFPAASTVRGGPLALESVPGYNPFVVRYLALKTSQLLRYISTEKKSRFMSKKNLINRAELLAAMGEEFRQLSTATILFHQTIADRLGMH